MRCCSMNDAQGSLLSDLLLKFSNKRLSGVQLSSLLCQPAIQSFELLTLAGHLLL